MSSTGPLADNVSPSSEAAPPDGRFGGLDGLRGLAALSVFILHVVDMLPAGRVPQRVVDSPLHVVFDGTAAVDLFFVLSGFVLALPFVGARAQPVRWASFATRRLFRLYPAYWATIGLALWFRTALYAPDAMRPLSAWTQQLWVGPLAAADVLRHALMIGPEFDVTRLDPVIWSLITEMRMSLVFPLVLVALRPVRGWRGGVIAVAAAVAVALGAPLLRIHTFTYLPMFVLGAVVATLRQPLLARARRLGGVTAALVCAVALVFYDVRFALFGWRFDYYASDLVMAAGSALLVVLVAGRPRWSAALCRPSIAFLGRVSYSFYLVHLPVLLLVTSWLYPRAPSLALCALVGLGVSLGLSWVLFTYVERPFHALGRQAAELVAGDYGYAARSASMRPGASPPSV